ncbi:hypothetical protein [Enterococcus sp.]|uniref:hypothetical protein n=1 Tax=Enterococcus sp. TaxID=35783 RepID=UPI002FC8281B
MNEAKFETQLQRFLTLLRKEKKVLVKGQSEKLEELVEQKGSYVDVLNNYEGNVTPRMKELIQSIQFQQEENLLLTQQAISYQTVLMDAVKKTMQTSTHTTYSKTQGQSAQRPTTMINTKF